MPPLSGSLDHDPRVADSAQRLELTTELNHWIKSTNSPAGAVSMLNLLAFRSGQREAYAEYGKAFADSVGSRRGGVAKIVGKAIDAGATGSYDGWDEVSSFSIFLIPASKLNVLQGFVPEFSKLTIEREKIGGAGALSQSQAFRGHAGE